jgi:hypothetical protein
VNDAMTDRLRRGHLHLRQQLGYAGDRSLLTGQRRTLTKQRAACIVFHVKVTDTLTD